MGITPLRFTGISTFSDDFQAIVERSVAIAKLPVTLMQNQQTDLLRKKQSLSSLGGDVRALAEAVATLGAQGANQGLAISSSSSKVSVAMAGATEPASYTITNITSLAQRASEATQTGLATFDATAVDSDDILELVFDGVSYEIDLTTYGNDLEGLKAAVQNLADENDFGLTVSIINTGDPATPYHLAISATEPGAKGLQIWTGAGATGTNLLTSVNQGSDAEFDLNGVTVTKSDNFINGLIPGVNLTLLETTAGETITIGLSSSRAALRTSLESFVEAYNAMSSALNAQIGAQAGLLSGDFIVGHTKGILRTMVGHSDGGVIGSLAALGVELDKSGKMTFNAPVFSALSNAEFEDAFRFLGSETTGFGAFVESLDAISNPLVDGMIEEQQDQYDATDTRLQSRIDTMLDRIDFTQGSLLLQLQKADALLALLEGQQRMLDASLEAVNFAQYGRRD